MNRQTDKSPLGKKQKAEAKANKKKELGESNTTESQQKMTPSREEQYCEIKTQCHQNGTQSK
jgi:hypothetical protein